MALILSRRAVIKIWLWAGFDGHKLIAIKVVQNSMNFEIF